MTTVQDYDIHSRSLLEVRRVTVFIPPDYRPKRKSPVVFCADGQAVAGFSERLHYAMRARRIPGTVVIGAHSRDDTRAQDYIPGVDDDRFAAHETFFTDEL